LAIAFKAHNIIFKVTFASVFFLIICIQHYIISRSSIAVTVAVGYWNG